MILDPNCSPWAHGRPIRSRRGRVVLPDVAFDLPPATASAATVTSRESTSGANDLTMPPRARVWVEGSRHAISSVASFRWTALSLEAVGAPGDLIQRALRAADDEAEHSVLCLDLAVRSGGPALRIVTDASELTRHRRRPDNLLESATSALLDGVVGEGFAMRRLGLAAQRCTEFRPELERLAADEERHAELGVDIVMWCVSVRPWMVSELALALSTIGGSSPDAVELHGLSNEELACVGMCPPGDMDRMWADVIAVAETLVADVRSLV
jgi:hypothetical protein